MVSNFQRFPAHRTIKQRTLAPGQAAGPRTGTGQPQWCFRTARSGSGGAASAWQLRQSCWGDHGSNLGSEDSEVRSFGKDKEL